MDSKEMCLPHTPAADLRQICGRPVADLFCNLAKARVMSAYEHPLGYVHDIYDVGVTSTKSVCC